MVDRGFTDPRYTTDIPSLSRLAEACGMHTSTISSAIKGAGRKPSAATVVALTRALGDDVAEWLGEERAAAWGPPAESSLLTDRQRKAVEEIIRAMTERREDVTGHGPASITHAGESPAPTDEELEAARAAGERDATDNVVAVMQREPLVEPRHHSHEALRTAYLEGWRSLKVADLVRAASAASEQEFPAPRGAGDGDNVTPIGPSAEALDPTLPDDVAARSEEGKGRAQAERDRQDEEGES